MNIFSLTFKDNKIEKLYKQKFEENYISFIKINATFNVITMSSIIIVYAVRNNFSSLKSILMNGLTLLFC